MKISTHSNTGSVKAGITIEFRIEGKEEARVMAALQKSADKNGGLLTIVHTNPGRIRIGTAQVPRAQLKKHAVPLG